MTCARCGAEADYGHHVTGRDDRGHYLDPKFTAPLCHSCHELVHDDWHTLGVADLVVADTELEILQLGLTRTAAFAGRLSEGLPEPLGGFISRLAAWLARCAQRLRAAIRTLDDQVPGWRTSPNP
jgi:hypothetical protein